MAVELISESQPQPKPRRRGKPTIKVSVTYRVYRRSARARAWVPIGRRLTNIEDALMTLGTVKRTWPQSRLVRITTLTETLK